MQRPGINGIVRLRTDAVAALRTYFSLQNPNPPARLVQASQRELDTERDRSIEELDLQCTFALLSELEALIRDDFFRRRTQSSSH